MFSPIYKDDLRIETIYHTYNPPNPREGGEEITRVAFQVIYENHPQFGYKFMVSLPGHRKPETVTNALVSAKYNERFSRKVMR